MIDTACLGHKMANAQSRATVENKAEGYRIDALPARGGKGGQFPGRDLAADFPEGTDDQNV